MTGPIEGRWLIDFGDDGPADRTGNEVVLGGGVVALAHDGKPARPRNSGSLTRLRLRAAVAA